MSSSNALFARGNLSVSNISCEYAENPISINTKQPRLTWQLKSSERNQVQTAYEVLVADSRERIDNNEGNVWDTKKTSSSNSVFIEYSGKELQSGKQYFWKVKVWDKTGAASEWSKTGYWIVGFLNEADWTANWIGANPARIDTNLRYAALLFRKQADIPLKPVKAIARICGLGFSELYINGKKISDNIMDPAWTDYTKRVMYKTFDVTGLIQKGHNAIGVILGNGWYDLATPDLFSYEKSTWTDAPKLLLNITLTYADGSQRTIVSDKSWKWSTSNITFNCIRGGETIDARLMQPGWNRPGFKNAAWMPAIDVAAPTGKIVAQTIPSEHISRLVKPVKITEPKPGVYVFDLGEHIAGYVRFKTAGTAGQKVVLDFDEELNPDGTITTKTHNTHTYGRYQVGEFILSGKPGDVFEPRFTYHGFRYIQVRGVQTRPKLIDLVGCVVHNNLVNAGSFTCSKELINKVQYAYRNSILNSMHGVLTEPAREKINWTQDAHNMIEGGIYNFDYATFANKWLDDIIDSQEPNGHLPSINPNGGWGRTKPNRKPPNYSDPWWGGIVVEIPWLIYKYYGDRDALERAYQPMKKYVDYLGTTAKDQYFLDWSLGDWLEIGHDPANKPVHTPIIQTSTTAYFFYAKLLSEAASLLGYTADAEKYKQLSLEIKEAFNKRFFNSETGMYSDDSQTAQILPLYLGLAPENKRALVLQQLLTNIEKHKGHISSGFVGYLYLLYGLTEAGRADVVYEMATKEDYPGWGIMMQNGSTTLWESWSGNAYNFSSLGGVGNWYYQALAGINPVATEPGFKKILIRPNIVGDLKWVKASYNSLYGKISSEWKVENGTVMLNVSIPANTTCEIHVPGDQTDFITESGEPVSRLKDIRFLRSENGKSVFEIGSGNYSFKSLTK